MVKDDSQHNRYTCDVLEILDNELSFSNKHASQIMKYRNLHERCFLPFGGYKITLENYDLSVQTVDVFVTSKPEISGYHCTNILVLYEEMINY
jgi:hypothetical protein